MQPTLRMKQITVALAAAGFVHAFVTPKEKAIFAPVGDHAGSSSLAVVPASFADPAPSAPTL